MTGTLANAATAEKTVADEVRDPLDVLLAFHDDVRAALASLHGLVRAMRAGAPVSATAERLVFFFEGPLLWHDEDEEVSLLPRLRRLELPQRARTAVEQCHRGHDRLETTLEAILPTLRAIASGAACDPVTLELHRRTLAGVLEGHLALEERELFPLARDALAPAERHALGAEIGRRHGVRTRPRRARAL